MLQTIREYTQGWVAGTIITIIILSFALWGIHSYFVGGSSNENVVEVNGVQITKQQLALAYERLRRQVQSQYNANHPFSVKDESALRSRALQSLIELEVMKQASTNQGFMISDRQIDSYLQSMPEFQVNGQFSVEKFQELLSASFLSTSEFLELIRESLLVDQPKLGIVFTSISLPDEVSNTISLINQERDIEYINIITQSFLEKPIIISPKEIQNYYKQNQAEFSSPERVNVEYIQLSLKDLSQKFNPTEAVLKSFYNDNINNYTQPAQSKDTPPKIFSFAEVKDKVKEAYIRQHAEEKFSDLRDQLTDLAYEHPESLNYAATTLNLPIMTSELFAKDHSGKDISQYKKVREAAFSHDVMVLQNNSDVIQLNPETLVVIHLKSHVPSSVLSLKEVSKQIETKLGMQQAMHNAEELANQISKKLNAGADKIKVANAYQLKWINTGLIGRYSTKIDTAILDLAFRMPDPVYFKNQNKNIYDVARLPNGFAVIGLKSVKPGSITDSKQKTVFAEQLETSDGLLEYELYKRSLVNQANIENK